jgi:death-on-curing family protein
MMNKKSEIIIYQTESGQDRIDVRLDGETVWLDLNQISTLFQRDKSVISRHLNNIYKTGELDRAATVAKRAIVQKEGGRRVTRNIVRYNLDAIISVGYRVNSIRGTQFRSWATDVLREHLVEGITVDRKRLEQKGLEEARQTLALLANTLERQDLISDEGRAVLNIVSGYARTWKLLWQYDEDSLPPPAGENNQAGRGVAIGPVRQAIATLKTELLAKGEATDIFGQERGDGLSGILGAISQTFAGEDLYGSIAEKAANLLYFIIKDHPFVDGNKRIGSFLFLLFLQENQVELEIDSRAMVALTLLIAASDPTQKDLLVRLIINLLQGR